MCSLSPAAEFDCRLIVRGAASECSERPAPAVELSADCPCKAHLQCWHAAVLDPDSACSWTAHMLGSQVQRDACYRGGKLGWCSNMSCPMGGRQQTCGRTASHLIKLSKLCLHVQEAYHVIHSQHSDKNSGAAGRTDLGPGDWTCTPVQPLAQAEHCRVHNSGHVHLTAPVHLESSHRQVLRRKS